MEKREVKLTKVLTETGEKDITVTIVPFNRRNDDHVDFVLGVSDMFGRAPSPFKTVTDAAVRYVELFVAHTAEQADDPKSDYSLVHADKRAARILFNDPAFQKEMADFFMLA